MHRSLPWAVCRTPLKEHHHRLALFAKAGPGFWTGVVSVAQGQDTQNREDTESLDRDIAETPVTATLY